MSILSILDTPDVLISALHLEMSISQITAEHLFNLGCPIFSHNLILNNYIVRKYAEHLQSNQSNDTFGNPITVFETNNYDLSESLTELNIGFTQNFFYYAYQELFEQPLFHALFELKNSLDYYFQTYITNYKYFNLHSVNHISKILIILEFLTMAELEELISHIPIIKWTQPTYIADNFYTKVPLRELYRWAWRRKLLLSTNDVYHHALLAKAEPITVETLNYDHYEDLVMYICEYYPNVDTDILSVVTLTDLSKVVKWFIQSASATAATAKLEISQWSYIAQRLLLLAQGHNKLTVSLLHDTDLVQIISTQKIPKLVHYGSAYMLINNHLTGIKTIIQALPECAQQYSLYPEYEFIREQLRLNSSIFLAVLSRDLPRDKFNLDFTYTEHLHNFETIIDRYTYIHTKYCCYNQVDMTIDNLSNITVDNYTKYTDIQLCEYFHISRKYARPSLLFIVEKILQNEPITYVGLSRPRYEINFNNHRVNMLTHTTRKLNTCKYPEYLQLAYLLADPFKVCEITQTILNY